MSIPQEASPQVDNTSPENTDTAKQLAVQRINDYMRGFDSGRERGISAERAAIVAWLKNELSPAEWHLLEYIKQGAHVKDGEL